MLTQQEILDKTITHFFIEKGIPGMQDDLTCAYYVHATKARCAIGNLMSLATCERLEFAAGGVFDLIEEHRSDLEAEELELLEVHKLFLDQLQTAHDTAARNTSSSEDRRDFREQFKDKLEGLLIHFPKLNLNLLPTQ